MFYNMAEAMVETKKHLCQQDGHKIMNKDSFQQLISTRQKNWKFVPIGLVLKIARSATTLVEARQLTHSFKVNFTLFHYLEFFKFNCFWASSNHRLYLLHYNSQDCRWPWRRPNDWLVWYSTSLAKNFSNFCLLQGKLYFNFTFLNFF